MRIALLHPTYWPEVRRGSERLVHDLGSALAAAGQDVTVLTSHPGPRSIAEEERVTVVRHRRPPVPDPGRWGYEDHLASAPLTAWSLLGGRYDLAHAFFPVDAWAATRARRRGGPPVVFSLHGIPTRQYLVARRRRLPMILDAARDAAVVTVLSQAAAEPYRRYLFRPPRVVPGGVFTSRFAVAPDGSRGPRTLICAASLDDRRKRGPLLLRAFASLRARHPDLRLLLAGRRDSGHRRPDLELPDGAMWIDGDDSDRLARAYAGATASVLPSIEEAFGLTLVESLAAGTPVVAARSGASPEVVAEERVGRLFQPDDRDDLERAMAEALELGESPGIAEACRAAARAFDWEAVLPQYERLYEEAVRGN